MFLIYSASRICSFCSLFWCSNIVVFSVRIFHISAVGHECFFKCRAMELVSERCIVSLPYRVVEVKLIYISLFSEIQSPKRHFNWYIKLFFCKTPIEGEELSFMNKLEVFNLLQKLHCICNTSSPDDGPKSGRKYLGNKQ